MSLTASKVKMQMSCVYSLSKLLSSMSLTAAAIKLNLRFWSSTVRNGRLWGLWPKHPAHTAFPTPFLSVSLRQQRSPRLAWSSERTSSWRFVFLGFRKSSARASRNSETSQHLNGRSDLSRRVDSSRREPWCFVRGAAHMRYYTKGVALLKALQISYLTDATDQKVAYPLMLGASG